MKREPMDFEALKKEAAMRMKGQPQGKGIDTILRPMLKEFLEWMPYAVGTNVVFRKRRSPAHLAGGGALGNAAEDGSE